MSALHRWRTELANGQRTPTTYDNVWRAACLELSAYEAQVSQVREHYLADARKLVPDPATANGTQKVRAEWGQPATGVWK